MVALIEVLTCEPLVPLGPDQPSPALQAVALLLAQCKVVLPPGEIVLGVAVNVTVGCGCETCIETV